MNQNNFRKKARLKFARITLILGLSLICTALHANEKGDKTYYPISLDGFADGIRHWQRLHDTFDYPRCDEADITCIADNILLYQRINGGWPKNRDPARVLSEKEKQEIKTRKLKQDTTLDNRNTYTQILYLAETYSQTRDEKYRDASLRGLEFILAAQLPNGGWTHSPPNTKSYYGYITLADDVMPGVLSLLRKAATRQAPFDYLSPDINVRCQQALARGEKLLLSLQVQQAGHATIWAGQYHPVTLAPIGARTFELPALVTSESVAVLDYLMSIPKPNAEIIKAVDAAARWFNAHALSGFRVEHITVDKERFDYHSSDKDKIIIEDNNAPLIWARFYELDSNTPFMANRDGKKVFKLEDVHRERRTGYAWYGYWPADFLVRYAQWKKNIN